MFDHPSEFVTFKASSHLPGVELYSARLVTHAFAPHAHDAYSLGAIEMGVERFRCRGSEHVAPAGTLVMINPDEIHTGQAEADAGWTYQMLYIEPRLFEQLTGAGAYFPSAMAHDPALTARFRQVFRAMWQASDDIAFLSAFTTLVDDVVARHGRHAAPVETAAPHALGRAIERIEDGLGGALTVAMLADAAGLSLFHFIRAFSARYHVPPHQYLQARRTARAKLLLAQRMPPAQAADAVGLTDQSHLNRWFKRAYGVTPAQYQQQIGTRPASGARA